MIVLEAIPWLISFAVLAVIFNLGRVAFSSGESAGRPEIHLPPPKPEASESSDG